MTDQNVNRLFLNADILPFFRRKSAESDFFGVGALEKIAGALERYENALDAPWRHLVAGDGWEVLDGAKKSVKIL